MVSFGRSKVATAFIMRSWYSAKSRRVDVRKSEKTFLRHVWRMHLASGTTIDATALQCGT
eukprot:11443933-Ditylum_brightwellii.AAC.1